MHLLYFFGAAILLIHFYTVLRIRKEGAELKKHFGLPASEVIPINYEEPGADTVVFCVHGFSASVLEFRYLAELLRKEKISYQCVPLPGFGEFNALDLLHIQADQWVKRVTEEYLNLTDKYKNVIMVGHSMGSMLVLIAALQKKPQKVLLSAPYIKTKRQHQLLKKIVLNPILFRILLLFRPATIKSGNKSIHKYRNFRFVYDTVPAQAVRNLWQLTNLYTLSELREVPFYLFLGDKDNTIENNEVIATFNSNGIQPIIFKYPELGHNLLEESAGDNVLEQMIQIIKEK